VAVGPFCDRDTGVSAELLANVLWRAMAAPPSWPYGHALVRPSHSPAIPHYKRTRATTQAVRDGRSVPRWWCSTIGSERDPYNLVNEGMPDAARYGLSFVDIVLISGFIFAVLMGVKNSRKTDDHAKWMVSTVFWAVSPGLFRLLFVPLVVLETPDLGSKAPLLLATAGLANILVLSLLMFRDRQTHPAYLSAAIGSLVMFVGIQVGDMQWWISFADSVFTI